MYRISDFLEVLTTVLSVMWFVHLLSECYTSVMQRGLILEN